MVTLLSGLVGGFVATIVMTILMMALGGDSPPPTAAFWSKYVGDGEPTDFMMQGMILHLFYGSIAGAIFAKVIPLIGFITVSTVVSAALWGLLYGFILFLFAAMFWMKIVLKMDADREAVGMFLLFHLVYGAVPGTWIGLGILA